MVDQEKRRRMRHEWHVAINRYMDARRDAGEKDHLYWMYDAKEMAEEIERLPRLFRAERLGELPKLHRQCSHSPTEPVPDNHLTCCLGVKCRECPMLLALDRAQVSADDIDVIKAQTCVGHIMTESGRNKGHIDTSEGFIFTVDDRMYWDRLHSSLAQTDAEE